MDSIDAYLAELVDLAIVVDKVQLAAPLEMLATLGLVEFHLQRKRQHLAVLEFENSLHLCPILVSIYLEAARGPVEHVDELVAEMGTGR